MKRRQFIQAAGVGLGAAAVAKPAIAQSMPEIRWRLSSGFPKALDTLYGGAEAFVKFVSDQTDGRFQIQSFAAGEIVGTLQAADAVSNGTIEAVQTASYYYFGKDPTFGFGTAVPFGLNCRQINAWMYHGGGMELMNEFYAKHNIYALPAGNTGSQMGGWFRKEIKNVQDLQGLKMRIGGFGGVVLSKLGGVPQNIPGGDIYPALERGTIDAAEWVGPYDDEKLGFNKIAPFYYYPGWWEGGPMIHVFIHLAKWNELPKHYKSVVQAAAAYANVDMMAKYDAKNPAALRRLIGGGAQMRPFPQEVLEASFKAATELYDELSTRNENWRKVYESFRSFRNEQYLWWQVAEYTFDSFMIRARARS
jgi:TRAP-type mannitol/chloroaromatic compound transport system substrate-binding protein